MFVIVMHRWGKDHPRSRGVYYITFNDFPKAEGSSPLARGLLRHFGVNTRDRGIIPARAGFTRPVDSRKGVRSDHPRSRGVYAFTVREDGDHWGSSPLARGLRAWVLIASTISRIIPARAGFTMIFCAAMLRSTDHPRSRGVYA